MVLTHLPKALDNAEDDNEDIIGPGGDGNKQSGNRNRQTSHSEDQFSAESTCQPTTEDLEETTGWTGNKGRLRLTQAMRGNAVFP